MNSCPIIVSLNGTLIRTDMLHEAALHALHEKPLDVLRIPYWLWRGKIVLKRHLARYASLTPSVLPFNQDLLDWLKQQKAEGRKIILCTASDLPTATAIADHLGIFDDIIASGEGLNLKGQHKAKALEKRFGRAGFDYVGHAHADLAVWQCARRAIIVNASPALAAKTRACCDVEKIFSVPVKKWDALRGMLRPHQWLKNLLLFVPLFAAHQLTNGAMWPPLIAAFISFSLCASSVYIFNDLFDLESDRQHPRKRARPFASGLIPVWVGVALAPILLSSSMVLAWHVNVAFFSWQVFYFALTYAYSAGLKRLMLVDCLTLAMLYTLRIIAGAAAAGMGLSFWLLAFGVFLFLSLAFVKRYAELEVQLLNGQNKVHGRGYYTSGASLIQTLGVTSGYASVLVLALYLNSDAVVKLYRAPEFVWGVVPVMLFWISRMWMQAHRGKMHDDPLVFAVKDKASLLAGAAFAGVLWLGTVWSW